MDPRSNSSSPEGLPPFFRYLGPSQIPSKETEKSGSAPGSLPIPGAHRAIKRDASPSSSSTLYSPQRKIIDMEFKELELSRVEPNEIQELAKYNRYDHLSPAELQAYITLIKENKKNADFTKANESVFFSNLTSAIQTALNLHTQFRHYFPGQPVAKMNVKTGAVLCSIDQFKAALAIARSHFPNLMVLASNEEQNVLLARLIQTILCGQQAIDSNLPITPVIFNLRELYRQALGPQLHEVPEGQTYAFNHLASSIKPEQNDLESMKDKIQEVVRNFVQDNFERGGNRFQKGINGPTSNNGLGLKPGEFNVLDSVLGVFVNTLRAQPEYAKVLLKKSKDSLFYEMVSKLFDEKPTAGKKTIHQVLNDFFLQSLRKNESRPDVCANIKNLINLFNIPQGLASEIAEKANCPPKEAETLILMKLLELVTILQQSSEMPRSFELLKVLMQYVPSDGEMRQLTTSKAGGMRCCFITPNCDSLHLLNRFNLHLTALPKEVGENFCRDEELTLATIDVTEMVPSLSTQTEHSVAMFPIGNPKFNWKVPMDFVDFLAKQIPLSHPIGENVDASTLQSKLISSQKVLEDIAKLTKGQVLIANSKSSFSAVTLEANEPKGGKAPKGKSPSEMESLEALLAFVKELHTQLAAYRIATIQAENPAQSKIFIATLKDKVLNASIALSDLSLQYMQNNQYSENERLHQILGILTADVAGLLPSPGEELSTIMEDWSVLEPPSGSLEGSAAAAVSTTIEQPARRSYLADTVSWVYGAVSSMFTPRTLTVPERLMRFKGKRIFAPEVVSMARDYLRTPPNPDTMKTLPTESGKLISLPQQFYADLTRLPLIKINGKTAVDRTQFDIGSEDGKAAFLKQLGQQCIQIQSALGLSERSFKYIARFAHQQLVHDMTGRLAKDFEGIIFGGGLEAIDFSLVEDKAGKRIKISFQLILEPWARENDETIKYGFMGVKLDVLVPAVEFLGNPDNVKSEELIPHAEAVETFTRICKTREDAQRRLG